MAAVTGATRTGMRTGTTVRAEAAGKAALNRDPGADF